MWLQPHESTWCCHACKGHLMLPRKWSLNYFQELCTQQFQAPLIPNTLVSRVTLWFQGGSARYTWCCEGWDQFLRRAVFSTAPSTVPPNTLVSKACKGQTYAAAKRNDHLINYFQTLCAQQFQATLIPDTLVSRALQGTQNAAMGETSSFEELCFQQLQPKYHQTHWSQRLARDRHMLLPREMIT